MQDSEALKDCSFRCGSGIFNYRVGAIIMDDRKMLMACNPGEVPLYHYSVGGRVKFGESLEEAILREVEEETGVICEIERLAVVHENFFKAENDVLYHEISIYFTLKPNESLLAIKSGHLTNQGPEGEYLAWIDLDNCEGITFYPEFFKSFNPFKEEEFQHIVTRTW